MGKPLHTVVETDAYLRAAKRAKLSEADREEITSYLAANPTVGTSLGGGLHKTRIARAGGGKSGGYRTVHFYRNETLPVFLLTVFAKSEKGNLDDAEQNSIAKEADKIGKTYGGSDE